MITLFRSIRWFARSAKGLARFWYTLTSAWGSFFWRYRTTRKYHAAVKPKIRKFYDVLDDLAHENNTYRRRRLAYELRQAWNDVRDTKALNGYPRHGPSKIVQIDHMMTLLNYRYYASPT